MATFIQVIENRVHWKFEADENPYAHMDPGVMDVRDVTNVSPQPEEGWVAKNDGTYVPAPIEPEPIQVPYDLTAVDFQNHCYTQLGLLQKPDDPPADQLVAGISRFGAILRAVRVGAETDDVLFTALDRYNTAVAVNSFGFAATAMFFHLIGPIITDEEQAAILQNWPRR